VEPARAAPTNRVVTGVYAAGAAVSFVAFAALGILLAVTIPYHDYDSFAFGNWSRAIAEHGKIDPLWAGPLASSRPIFYELQGALWSATGISFTAGRLLSLVFALLVPIGAYALARALGLSPLVRVLAVVAVVCIPAFDQNALSGETDVPAAALVALAAAAALRPTAARPGLLAVGSLAAAAVLMKQTSLIPLAPLAVYLLIEARTTSPREVLRRPVGALVIGLVVGLAYDLTMALRFHLGLLDYLRTGSGGIWAQLADETRTDALLRGDVLGSALRLPLEFALIYAVLRVARVRHGPAGVAALVVALVWGIAGPFAAGVGNGPFATANAAFTFVGFALLLAVSVVARVGPESTRTALVLGVLALPPLLVWVSASTYADRLAAPAWPALAVLVALALGAGIEALARAGFLTPLAAAVVLAVSVWMGLTTYDGFHGELWSEYRALGWSGLGDSMRTTNIVLPAIQQALAVVEPQLGDGRLVSQDPRFAFFLPGAVDTRTPLQCEDLRGERLFVLLTADESERAAQDAGGLATPGEWSRCTSPKVRQLSDGSNGYAVFAVGP
jgi:hypothetical protein